MDIRLLRKYRQMARDKFYLEKEEAVYPRCRYRWMHDREELKPQYFLCDNGERMWNEKNDVIKPPKIMKKHKKCFENSVSDTSNI